MTDTVTVAQLARMQFVTYNIRYDSRPDSITVKESLNVLSATDPLQEPEYLSLNNEQRWSLRRLRIAEILLKEDIAVIGEYKYS